jgi:diguanylate cyclase (GGDEF)-like protein
LLVLSGKHVGELHRLAPGGQLVLGRSEDAGVVLDDDGISRHHAMVLAEGSSATLQDLGSRNGTWVGDEKVTRRALVDGDRIRLGFSTDLKFTFADEREAAVQRDLVASTYREPLTDLHNRRYFQEALGADFASARRHGRPLSLLLLDIDRFKLVNDTHGHLAGDEALRTVAAVLRSCVRREDHLARIGGDEFAVLAESGESGALLLAEKLREAVEQARCPLPGGRSLSVTVSMGIAAAHGLPGEEPGWGERDLYTAADLALRRAKQEGRNRYILGSPGSGLAETQEPPASGASLPTPAVVNALRPGTRQV